MNWYRLSVLGLCVLLSACSHQIRRERAPSSDQQSTASIAAASMASANPQAWTKDYLKNADRFLADVYDAYPFEVFCGCDVDVRTKHIDLDRCGFEPQNPNSTTNTRMQWEHVFPKSWVAAAMDCGTRTECLRDQHYVDAETDLYNLVPGIGSLNATRGDRWLWEISGEDRQYGRCDFEVAAIDGEAVIEPPDAHKGNIARIVLYYIEQHGLDIDDQAIALYLSWHRLDPVDAAEFHRAERIELIVGHANPWVTGER